jgi:hypothetical protein
MKFEVAPKETEIQANWNDARLYCLFLEVSGETGWRLPTKEELNQIYFSINDFEQWIYWSATGWDSNHTWVQYFSGVHQYDVPNDYDGCYVRAIRDIK